jgi:hypothetical protein
MADPLEHAIRHLAALDRPSASEGEREAAEWIAGELRALGLEARVEQERAHGGYWWPFGLLNALGLLGAALRGRASVLGRLLAAAATVLLVDDLDHRNRWFRRLLPRRPTYNVVAEAGDPAAERTLLVVAHHDAAHGGAIFDPTLIRWYARTFPERFARATHWPPLLWAVLAGPALVALGLRRPGRVLAAGTIAAMVDIGARGAVPGANDNLTGVATVLGVARALRERPVQGVRVLLVSTGAEESNSEGMQAFGRRHFPALPVVSTEVVTVDTVGSGTLCVPEAEGFLVAHPYDAALKDLASACAQELGIEAVRGLRFVFATDAQIAVHAGYRSVMLGSIDELKLPRNYHRPSDVADNVDLGNVRDAVAVVDAMIRARAAQGG